MLNRVAIVIKYDDVLINQPKQKLKIVFVRNISLAFSSEGYTE